MTRKVRAAIKEKVAEFPVVDMSDTPPDPGAVKRGLALRDAEIIQPTDLTTFDPEEYVQGVYAGIQDAMGEADLYSVACALDMSLDTLLRKWLRPEEARAPEGTRPAV